MSNAKITIEDEKQKTYITITDNGNNSHTIDLTFDPELDLTDNKESLALKLASVFMDFLTNSKEN